MIFCRPKPAAKLDEEYSRQAIDPILEILGDQKPPSILSAKWWDGIPSSLKRFPQVTKSAFTATSTANQ
jgi:hypothetical protein